MKTLEKIGMSIGDYAEAMLKGSAPKIATPTPVKTLEESGPDYSHIQVDEATVQALLGGKQVKSPPKVAKKTPEELVQEFQQLIVKAKGLIQEMTSVGMIGVNHAGSEKSNPSKKKKLKVSNSKSKGLQGCIGRLKSKYGELK